MKINIKATNLEITAPLKEYVELKIGSLAKFVNKIENNGTEVLARVEIARTSKHHEKGDVYRVEININAPQNIVRVEEEGSDVRALLDIAQSTLKQLLVKHKEKREL
jgi:putative sigma-54 modulation protein